MTNSTQHPTEDVLEEYHFQRLPEPQAEALEEHLLICGGCQERLERLEAFIGDVRTAVVAPVPQATSVRTVPVWAGAVAASLVLAGGLAWYRTTPATGAVPQDVLLTVSRGAENQNAAPAGKPLAVRIPARELPAAQSYRIELTDAGGKVVWQQQVKPSEGMLIAQPSGVLDAGQYWVRLYLDGRSEPEKEFSLVVRPGA